ncbi:MAG: hypothetical protein QM648_01945 [Solirubrobacterales bacterium]
MSLKPRHLFLAALATALLALPAFASAAKAPTYYRYGAKCNKKTKICLQSGYTNSKNSQLISFYVGLTCKSGSTGSLQVLNPVKIKNKKFSFTYGVSSTDKTESEQVYGIATISGKSTKKDKITGSWKIDKTATGCENTKSGKFTMKYKGAVHGG